MLKELHGAPCEKHLQTAFTLPHGGRKHRVSHTYAAKIPWPHRCDRYRHSQRHEQRIVNVAWQICWR